MLPKFNNSKFEKSVFEEIGRFKGYSITDFKSGLISKDVKKDYFINFANSQDEDVYNLIIEYYIRYLNGDYSFIDEFEFDEEGITPGYRADRLFSIIKDIQKIKYTNRDCKHILKFKSIHNKELHLFFSFHNDNLRLILIDLYHLGIYGTRFINGKEKEISIERIYKHNKKNKCDLADIKLLSK